MGLQIIRKIPQVNVILIYINMLKLLYINNVNNLCTYVESLVTHTPCYTLLKICINIITAPKAT